MSNLLDLVDQPVFRFERATGVTSIGQCSWVYNRAIDIDGLREFHRHLQQGRFSRRIERSRLRFARDRWVRPAEQPDPKPRLSGDRCRAPPA